MRNLTKLRNLLVPVALVAGFLVGASDLLDRLRSALIGDPSGSATGRTIDFDRELAERHPPRLQFMARDAGEAAAWKRELRRELRSVLRHGEIPRPATITSTVLRREETSDHVREEVAVETERGFHVPVTILVPRRGAGTAPHAAVLVVPGHGRGRSDCFDPRSYQRAIALEVARRGVLVAVPELRAFGSLGGGGDGSSRDPAHLADIRFNLRFGRTALGTYLHDLAAVLDLLAARADVDRARIGVAGVSLGGVLAIHLGALDGRIAAVASSGVLAAPSMLSAAERITEFDVPGIARVARTIDIAAAVAPGPLLIDADPDDQPGVTASAAEVGRAFEVVGAGPALSVHLHSLGHVVDAPFVADWLAARLDGRSR